MNIRKFRACLVLIAAASFVAVSAGCSSQPSEASSGGTPRETVLAAAKAAKQQHHTEQYDALKDGVVTFDEYNGAFDNVSTCYKASGVGVTTPVINPVDGFSYLFVTVGNGLDPDKVNDIQTQCLNKYWMEVSAAYNTVTPPKMDEALRAGVVSCMSERGFKTKGTETNLKEFMASGGNSDTDKRREALTTCVGDEAFKLYPDLPPINLVF